MDHLSDFQATKNRGILKCCWIVDLKARVCSLCISIRVYVDICRWRCLPFPWSAHEESYLMLQEKLQKLFLNSRRRRSAGHSSRVQPVAALRSTYSNQTEVITRAQATKQRLILAHRRDRQFLIQFLLRLFAAGGAIDDCGTALSMCSIGGGSCCATGTALSI